MSAMIRGKPTRAKPSRISFRKELGLRRNMEQEDALLPSSHAHHFCLASARAIIFLLSFPLT